MSGATRAYVVGDGDHLTGIAASFGLSADAIWNHPSNAALAAVRHPDMLAPGDVLTIPIGLRKWLPVTVGAVNVFTARLTTITVTLKMSLENDDGSNLLAGVEYVVSGARVQPDRGIIDLDGQISFKAPATAREVLITVTAIGRTFPVHIGSMDPIDVPSGVRARLAHLGYLDDHGPGHPVAAALTAFQADHGLPATGALDKATRAALVDAHGS